MKEGNDESSYARTSYIQKQILSLPKPIREKAIKEVYCTKQQSTPLCIADFGCSSAEENSLGIMFELIQVVDDARRELGHGPQEYQIYLNDLPKNDFNTMFRLFPANSLHFVHSSSSVHWLSQVPKGIEDNKRNIYTSRTSPPSVLKAYYDQFESDFLAFLRCRSKEVVVNGKMVLTLLLRQENDPYSNKKSACIWDLLATVLNDMVTEGYIDEERLNTFNVPMYEPSLEELKYLVEKEGSFAIDQVHVFGVSWDANGEDKHANLSKSSTFDSYDFAKCIRAELNHC
ncbi:Salicylate carboxymethyltransferase [Bienertia sinuspersici]